MKVGICWLIPSQQQSTRGCVPLMWRAALLVAHSCGWAELRRNPASNNPKPCAYGSTEVFKVVSVRYISQRYDTKEFYFHALSFEACTGICQMGDCCCF